MWRALPFFLGSDTLNHVAAVAVTCRGVPQERWPGCFWGWVLWMWHLVWGRVGDLCVCDLDLGRNWLFWGGGWVFFSTLHFLRRSILFGERGGFFRPSQWVFVLRGSLSSLGLLLLVLGGSWLEVLYLVEGLYRFRSAVVEILLGVL